MDKIEPSDQSERKSYRLFSLPAGETDDSTRARAWKGDSVSFHDVLDIINPLQHLPVISTVYRWLTGDTIGAVPRMVGDAIYGGPIGFVAGLFNAEVQKESGKDVGGQVVALLTGDSSAPAADPKTIAARDGAPAVDAALASDAASDAARADGATAIGPAVASATAAPAAPSGNPAPAAPARVAAHSVAAASGPHAIPAMATSDPNDPRAIFLARTNMLHRQVAADNGSLPGRALSNKVVPLQGIGIPAGLMRGAAPSAAIHPTAPVATGENGAPQTLPTNPPLVISQQMMEALDKYARLQQQRESKPDPSRGAHLDLSQ
jgi:hypothetical protein